jgi:hypothetical protein
MNLQADRIGRRALTMGAATGSILAATLTFAATQADAAYTAQVKAGTLQIRGDGASDRLVLTPAPTTLLVDVGEDGTADFTFDRSTFTAVNVQAGDGDDEVRVDNAVSPLELTIDGGAGDDTLIGANGNETLIGGAGNDFADGNIGADTARMGTGDDTFEWDPGDGSDTVDGQGGTDALDFHGSNIGEQLVASADGSHVRFTRNVAAIVMDLDNVEGLALRSLGGVDQVTVGDLTGTDMKTAAVDLGAFDGTPDATSDTVTVTGTAQRDNVAVTKAGGQVLVKGLATQTTIAGSDPGIDLLRVNTLDGDDNVTVAPDVADLMATAVDLGADG